MSYHSAGWRTKPGSFVQSTKESQEVWQQLLHEGSALQEHSNPRHKTCIGLENTGAVAAANELHMIFERCVFMHVCIYNVQSRAASATVCSSVLHKS